MPTERSNSFIIRIIDEAFNKGNLVVVDKLFSPDYLAHTTFGSASLGQDSLKWLISICRTAFPDLSFTIGREISVADQFAAHWTLQGTQTGSYLGNPPTGRQVNVQGIIFGRTLNGQIIEDWTLIDQMGILQQLGLVPPPR